MFEQFLYLFDKFSAAVLFFLVMTIEAGVPVPIPYDVVIILAGYRHVDLIQITLAVVLGNIIGSSILYYLSYRFGHSLILKYRRWLGISDKRLEVVERWFQRWGPVTIIVARLIPGFRFAATFLSGILYVPYFKVFLPSLFVGSLLWAVSYWFIGMQLGEHIPVILHVLQVWSTVLAIGFLCIVAFIAYKILMRLYGKRNP